MSQYDFGTIDPNTKSGTALASDLNSFRTALHTSHSGSSAPSYITTGMLWVDSTSANLKIKMYDGAQSIDVAIIDATNNVARVAVDSAATSYITSTVAAQLKFVIASADIATMRATGLQFNIASPYIGDSSNNELLSFTTTASAVNQINVANAATATNPVISAIGNDTNIGITLTPKGTGRTNIGQLALDGTTITTTAAQLNFVTGVTSAIQTQIDAKAPLTGAGTSGTWGISITGDAATTDGKSFGTFTAAGGIAYATSTTALAATAAGTSGQVLLSGGAGAPTWGTLAGGDVNIRVFTATGTYTPTAGYTRGIAFVTGGGGGSGGVSTSAGQSGGGGAGGTAIGVLNLSTLGAVTATVGAAGTAGATGANNGVAGGASTLSTLTGSGGSASAGVTGGSSSGANGGSATGGAINITGASGSHANAAPSGGAGGGSFWGGGGRSRSTSASGNDGFAYGAGAGGSVNTATTAQAGGAGAAGVIMIMEFN
jgi:hypothetical protein